MLWTQAKAVAVLAAAAIGGGANAQGFLSSLSEQVAAWMIPPAPTTTSSSTSQAGSPPIGGPAATTAGGGDGPPAAAASGTVIISWSTQYFTVTTGGPSPDGSQPTRSITDGGSVDSFPTTGSLDGSSLASGFGSITSGMGALASSRDAGSEAGPVITSGGSMPPISSESLGPSGSVSGATGTSTITDGISGESPQPGFTDDGDDDGWITSILTGSPYTPQDPVPGDIYGSTGTPGFPGSSQAEPITDGGGTGTPGSPRSSQAEPITDGSVPPTPSDDGPAFSQASVPGTYPSESALLLPEIFVVQLDPAVAGAGGGAAIESGAGAAAGPLGRRQQDVNGNDNNNNEFLVNAGAERSDDCSQATQFHIIDGELTRGGQKVSTGPPGLVGSAQRLAVSPTVGSVTKSWEIVDGELLWLNESFVGGRASFCVDDDTRAVFFSTLGEGSEAAGCTPHQLTPMFVAECPGLNPDGSIKSLLPAEETLILPPGIYFPGREPKDHQSEACRVTTAYWTVGQFTLAPAPTDMSRVVW